MPYYCSICDNCLNSEIINEDLDILCSAKDKTIKGNQHIRHCIKYTPIKKKTEIFPKVFLE